MDAAYFDNTVANGPDGLLSLTDVQVISWGSVTTLDCFAEALSLAETVGSVITTFIGNPVDTLMLAQLKSGTGLATPLLGIDPAVPTQRTIFGVPLISSPAVTPGAFWAVPKAKAFTVLRDDAAVVTDSSPFFSSDRTAVRCTIRAGFAFPHQAAIIRIDHGGS